MNELIDKLQDNGEEVPSAPDDSRYGCAGGSAGVSETLTVIVPPAPEEYTET